MFFFCFFFVILNEFALYFDCICVDGYVFENLFANIFLICCIVVQKKFFFLDDNFCNHFIIFVFFEVEFCEYRVSNANQQKNFWYTFACIFWYKIIFLYTHLIHLIKYLICWVMVCMQNNSFVALNTWKMYQKNFFVGLHLWYRSYNSSSKIT